MSGSMDTRGSGIAAVVEDLFFKDEYLEYLCRYGLTKTLTRTADGGSDAIRMKELVDMVKHLRKAVLEYQAKLRQLQATTNWPSGSDGNATSETDLQRIPAATQTSPRPNDPGIRPVVAETPPSRIPQPGAADADSIRLELRQTKAALQQAVERLQELEGAAKLDTAAHASGADVATSPVQLPAADHEADAKCSSPHLMSPRLMQTPKGEAPLSSQQLSVAAREAALAEAAGLRDQIQALQEEAAALQAERERMRAELQEAAAARKTAEAAVRDSGVALKQKDVELSLLKATHNKDMQWQQESIRKLQGAVDEHKKELEFEQEAVRELEYREKQANTRRAQLEREVASLRDKATQDQSGRGEIWNKLLKQQDEHKAALGEKEAELEAEKTLALNSHKTADRLKRELEIAVTDKLRAQEEAELARKETKDINSRVLDITRKNVSLEQDVKDAQHELQSLRSSSAAAVAAAEAHVEEAEQRAQEAALRVTDLEARLQEATTAADTARKEADTASAGMAEQGHGLKKLTAALTTVTAERDRLDAELSQANVVFAAQAKERSEAQGAREAAKMELAAAREELSGAQTRAEAAVAECRAARERQEFLESQIEALQEAVGCGDQKQMVGQLAGKVGHLETALAEAERQRRSLHNTLVGIRGNIRVFCRLKPCKGVTAVTPIHGDGVRAVVEGKPHDFYFDRVLGPDTTQEAAFAAVSDIVQSALDGYHVCLFSYGQTGSGKTYTMIGDTGVGAGAAAESAPGRGVIPRAVSMILTAAARLGAAGWGFRMEATFIEVYNEALRDLLAEVERGPGHTGGARVLDSAAIKHDPDAHTQIAGATRMVVDSEEVAQELLRRAARARSTDATAMNSESSRSHSVFTLHITGTNEAGDRLLGSLSLVDLAGSERLARSGAEGLRQKETCAINKSLASLGDIFQALSSKNAHIPYRNSKLTYLLQPALGGDGKTLMFVNINPEPPSAYESLCALRFAAKVNSVETAARGRGGARRNIVSGCGGADSGQGDSGPIAAEGGLPMPRRTSVMPPARGPVAPGGLPRAPLVPVKRNAPGLTGALGAGGGKERPSSGPRSSSLPAFKRRR